MKRTWDSCEADLSPLKSPFKIFAQFPSPHFCTAAISSISSAADHGFRFFRTGWLPLVDPFASNPSDFWTETGIVMFVPWMEPESREFSEGCLEDWPTGIFIVNGASTIELFGRLESLGKPEAISTWTQYNNSQQIKGLGITISFW